MRHLIVFLFFAALFMLSGCTEAQLASHVFKKMPGQQTPSQGTFKVGSSYEVAGKWYHPEENYNYSETGIASWYGPNFHGKPTANGEIFDMNELTAAHKTLQIPSLVRVTNLENGRSLVVRVNDRGPFKRGRIIDLSKRSAELLGFKNKGTAKVRVQVLSEESMAIAEAAKRGQDTRGVEVAMNDTGRLPEEMRGNREDDDRVATAVPPVSPVTAPVESVKISSEIPGKITNGNFYPDPVVQKVPVAPTTIYVQAGAFTVRENAQKLALQLQGAGRAQVFPTIINNRQFYRVRIPAYNVDEADAILASVVDAGNKNAIIVVD